MVRVRSRAIGGITVVVAEAATAATTAMTEGRARVVSEELAMQVAMEAMKDMSTAPHSDR